MALYQRASREIQNPLSLSPCNRARGKAQTRSERKECVRSTQIDRALGPKPSEIVNSDTGRHPSITVRDATITGLESIKEGKGCWVALYQRATREIQNSPSLYYTSEFPHHFERRRRASSGVLWCSALDSQLGACRGSGGEPRTALYPIHGRPP